MYEEKLKPILKDVENKDLEIAGGSVIGMVLATVNSLIIYIANLTIGKKKYEDVQTRIQDIIKETEVLKKTSLAVIDADKEVLSELLNLYKLKKENPEQYWQMCIKAVEFCLNVLELAFETLKISDEISKIGNKMLSSDFKICKYYSYASIQAAIVNVEINLSGIEDEKYKISVKNKCDEILELSKKYL